MKIAVIGANGYVGRTLQSALSGREKLGHRSDAGEYEKMGVITISSLTALCHQEDSGQRITREDYVETVKRAASV